MTRLASAVVLLAVLLATLWLAPAWATILLAAAVAAVAGAEVAMLARAAGADTPPFFVAGAAMVVCVACALGATPGVADFDVAGTVVLASVVAAGTVTLAAGPPGPATLTRAGVVFMAPIYIGLPIGALAALRVAFGPTPVLFLILLLTISDSAQFYTGRLVGRHKLAPAVSPAKTVEGALGGLVGATIAGALAGPRLALPVALTTPTGATLGLLIAAFGILGDLFESLLKRGVGAKDSSSIIPGHGGILDRVDSYLFAAPCYVLFLRWLA